ncbi:family 16 glycosylhydrolase [Paenibacillus sp. HWE-109]|uniref:family 16 glycosylhydrolase n=1 Tax=Paenibacillus sp. HWE-109 TaxID=1306526 RepID=UPI001EDF22A1|nr:family 16 glycosylhydrolase [Paenibacillus sp. HWE-109]UKS24791.1 family 16 glycosylhydrolase [Paenibacillus sp. HWE-109]
MKKLLAFGLGTLAAIAISAAAADEAKAAPPAGYNLVWQDEFNGTSLDEQEWNYRQNQYTDENNVTVSGGAIHLNMTRSVSGYRGAGVTTKRTFGYGYYELNAKWTNPGAGFHPSAWTQIWDAQLPKTNSLSKFTEIDFFEHYKNGQITAGYLNWNTELAASGGGDAKLFASNRGVYTGDYSNEYHTYGVDYGPGRMAFYKDNVLVREFIYPLRTEATLDKAASTFNSPMVFYLSTIPQNADPAQPPGHLYGTYDVDYFRYYTTTGTAPITSPVSPSPHNPIRTDDFESGNITNWNLKSGSWSIASDGSSNRLHTSTSSGVSMAVYNDQPYSSASWSDSAVQANFKLNGTTGITGLVARYEEVVPPNPTDPANYYYLRINATNQMFELAKVAPSATTVLASSPETFVSGTDYNLKLYLNGSTLKGYLNGVERLSVTDDQFTLGAAGFRAYNQIVSVDNFLSSRIMYSDDLESGNADKWTTATGTWSVATDGSYVLKNTSIAGEARAFANSASYNNAFISANIKLLTNTGYASVTGRYTDSNNFYMLRLDKVANKLAISKKSNGVVTDLASYPMSINTNEWYRMELSIVGNQLRGYLNGEEKLSAAENAPLAPGKVGVRAYTASFEVDNLYVEAR